MEPRARVGKNRGQQNFHDSDLQMFLYAHGDVKQSLDSTKKVLDELITDFVTELCFEAHRSASLAGRQKIKIDDIRFACRKNPQYLGRIEQTLQTSKTLEATKKMIDTSDDKIAVTALKAVEEPLGDADDDADMVGSKFGGKKGARK